MPPKEPQNFSFETMACVLAVMDANGSMLGNKGYDLMAKLDGKRSASSFQHQFRAVKNRGKELVAELGEEAGTPKARKTPKMSAGKKRDKSAAAAEGDEEEQMGETPSKKTKVKKEPLVEPYIEPNGGMNGIDGEFGDAMAECGL